MTGGCRSPDTGGWFRRERRRVFRAWSYPAAMDIELTDDEHLRALAALEAVVENNDDALAVLAGGDGERPLPALLAAYGQHTLSTAS